MSSIKRLVPVVAGIANYGNPFQIFLQRLFLREGEMTIRDRATGVEVKAKPESYPMFGETWYQRDYDVAGCPLREGDLVVDVGANQGFFTCYAAHRGARVFAFEPNPTTFQLLTENVSTNGFTSRVHAECLAIDGFEGDAELLCSSYRGGGTDTIHPKNSAGNTTLADEQGERIAVRVARLELQIPSSGQVRLLKLDCEGSELAVLKDLSDPSRFDSIAVEYHLHAYPIEALINCLLDFGTHQVYAVHGHILHAVRTDVLLDYAKNLN
jgi:FkbM family methyltransferase